MSQLDPFGQSDCCSQKASLGLEHATLAVRRKAPRQSDHMEVPIDRQPLRLLAQDPNAPDQLIERSYTVATAWVRTVAACEVGNIVSVAVVYDREMRWVVWLVMSLRAKHT